MHRNGHVLSAEATTGASATRAAVATSAATRSGGARRGGAWAARKLRRFFGGSDGLKSSCRFQMSFATANCRVSYQRYRTDKCVVALGKVPLTGTWRSMDDKPTDRT